MRDVGRHVVAARARSFGDVVHGAAGERGERAVAGLVRDDTVQAARRYRAVDAIGGAFTRNVSALTRDHRPAADGEHALALACGEAQELDELGFALRTGDGDVVQRAG